MSDARHTPTGDRSFAASMTRHLAAGAALVAVVALAFWGIGQFRGTTANGPVISAPTEATAPTSPEPTPKETTGDASPDETPSAPVSDPASPTDATTADPSETASPADGTRSSISVQVLDATTAGDGNRLQAVVDELRDLGYQVVATNRAVRSYERSTVFYSEGHRDDAMMIREDIPALGVVEEKPDNLSDSVDAHVIVGEDYPRS